MGLNVDNIFLQTLDCEAVIAAHAALFPSTPVRMALSEPRNGWVQLVDSHGTSSPSLAEALSRALKCRAICAQLYEASGDAMVAIFDNGAPVSTVETDEGEEPSLTIRAALEQEGIEAQLELFQHVFKAPHWRIGNTGKR